MKNEKSQTAQEANLSQTSQLFATMSEKVLKFRQIYAQDISQEKNDKVKNPFIIWYSPRNSTFQAHIIGHKCIGDSLESVLIECETIFLKKYNDFYGTNHKLVSDCDFEEQIENWSKDKLLVEYSKLSKRLDNLESYLAKAKVKSEKARLKNVARFKEHETKQIENHTI